MQVLLFTFSITQKLAPQSCTGIWSPSDPVGAVLKACKPSQQERNSARALEFSQDDGKMSEESQEPIS